MYVSDEWLRSNPSVTAYKSTSLTLRQQVAEEGIPRLGAEAALNAIKDWGKQASGITHLVVATTSTGCLPSADCILVKLLGLPPSTKRVMLYQAGCFGGTTALRVSKDIAENNPGARVLVVTSEVMSLVLRGPSHREPRRPGRLRRRCRRRCGGVLPHGGRASHVRAREGFPGRHTGHGGGRGGEAA